MRLTEHQQQVIREATKDVFGSAASVRLFGSRVDDCLRGGDIDLLVESPERIEEAGLQSAKLTALIQRRLGDQKIDVLCIWPGSVLSSVHKSALENGIVL